MKRIIFSMLAMVAMVSCSSEEGINPDNNTPVEIRLNGGVNTVTKAVTTTETLAKAFFANGTTTETYADAPWTATITGGSITFNPKQYYPVNDSSIFLKGYAPAGTYKSGTVSYTIDGDMDIIATNENSGKKSVPFGEITFDHLLTQLQFEVIASSAEVATAWGELSKIELTEQPTALELKLTDSNKLAAAENPIKASLITKGYTEAAIPIGAATSAGYIMILPGQTSIPLTVTTVNGTKSINVTLANNVATEKGKAHKITLTFSGTEITPTAKVTVWDEKGTTGSGTID